MPYGQIWEDKVGSAFWFLQISGTSDCHAGENGRSSRDIFLSLCHGTRISMLQASVEHEGRIIGHGGVNAVGIDLELDNRWWVYRSAVVRCCLMSAAGGLSWRETYIWCRSHMLELSLVAARHLGCK